MSKKICLKRRLKPCCKQAIEKWEKEFIKRLKEELEIFDRTGSGYRNLGYRIPFSHLKQKIDKLAGGD